MYYCANIIQLLISLGICLLSSRFKGDVLFTLLHCFLKVHGKCVKLKKKKTDVAVLIRKKSVCIFTF